MEKIVDVYSIEIGDMVAFMHDGKEIAGEVVESTDEYWTVEVATLSGFKRYNIVADDVTDIM